MYETELKWHGRYQARVSKEDVCGDLEVFMKNLEVSAYEFIEKSNVRFDRVSLFYRPNGNRHQFIYRKISSGTVCRNSVLVKYVSASQNKECGIRVFIRISVSGYMKQSVQDIVKGFIDEHLSIFLEKIGDKEYE